MPSQLSVSYEPDAEPPAVFLKLLDDAFGGDADTIRMVQEMFCCAIMGWANTKKFFYLFGPRDTGKSIISNVLRQLLGPKQVVPPLCDRKR